MTESWIYKLVLILGLGCNKFQDRLNAYETIVARPDWEAYFEIGAILPDVHINTICDLTLLTADKPHGPRTVWRKCAAAPATLVPLRYIIQCTYF